MKDIMKNIFKRSRRFYTVGFCIFAFLLLQFGIPADVILPRTYLESKPIGLHSREEFRNQLIADSGEIEISFDSKIETFKASEVGINTDIETTIAQLPTVKTTDRLIPFKPLYMAINKKTMKPVVHRDESVIRVFAASVTKRMNKKPVNSSAEIKDGQLVIEKDEYGVTYDAERLEKTLKMLSPVSTETVEVIPKKEPAKVQEKDLNPLKEEFSKKTSQSLSVEYGETVKKVEPKTLKKWLAVNQDSETSKWSIKFSPKAADEQIQNWAEDYNVAPGITQVMYLDDIETSRRTGASGQVLNVEDIKDQLAEWFSKPTGDTIVLSSSVLPPEIVATYTYSYSSAQLQKKLNAWIASHEGNYQVAVLELGGRGREASHNVAQQTVMASTYKTFLAFVAYKQAQSGSLNLNMQLVDGKTIEQCIEVMIVHSDNECAIALGRHIGWAKVDKIIAAAGFRNIVLNNYDENGNLKGDKLVNAREQAKFLAQLSAGSLINQTHTNKLLNYMKRQTYRDGIPAGSRGATVADKVGFLEAFIHDVGIVYAPNSTYALVIMSEGSSWANIRNLAQAIYDFMNE